MRRQRRRHGPPLGGGGRGGAATARHRARGRVGSLRSGRPPRVADRRAIEALGLEQPGRRRQVLLAFADPAAPGERGQQDLVDAPVERRELQPLLQIAERLVVRSAPDEMLQQRGMAAAEPAPLRGEPAVEGRAAVDLQAVEEVAGEQHATALAAAPARASRCPPAVARAISIASTKQSARSSRTVSPRVSTRRRPGSSTRLRILLRHQRSSPRGSLGTSHSSSQSWLRVTACGASAR